MCGRVVEGEHNSDIIDTWLPCVRQVAAANMFLKGEGGIERRNITRAEELYRQALEAEPDNVDALNGLGFAYYHGSDPDEGSLNPLVQVCLSVAGGMHSPYAFETLCHKCMRVLTFFRLLRIGHEHWTFLSKRLILVEVRMLCSMQGKCISTALVPMPITLVQ